MISLEKGMYCPLYEQSLLEKVQQEMLRTEQHVVPVLISWTIRSVVLVNSSDTSVQGRLFRTWFN